MDEPPPPPFRIVERDGRLVVEKTGEQAPPPRSGRAWTLPRIPRDPLALGRALFSRHFAAEQTADGQVAVTAAQLRGFIELSAPDDALYALSPRQQALLGFMAIPRSPTYGAGAAVLAIAAFAVVGPAVMIVFVGLFLAASTYFKDDFEAIQGQQVAPPAA